MSIYELPKFKMPKIKLPKFNFPKFLRNRIFWLAVLIIFLSSSFGFLAGIVSGSIFYLQIKDYLSGLNIKLPEIQKLIEKEYVSQTTQEETTINVVKSASPAVVSIVITKDVPIIEEYYYNPFPEFGQQFQIPQYRQKGTQKQEVGGGTGFIVSDDGMILTNKHVVLDTEADYTVLTNDGKSYPAKVLARDPVQDLAVIKIDQEKIVNSPGNFTLTKFPVVRLGDSDALQIGQTVIAIGNALGEFRNTVSVGVVSGLGRSITASGGGLSETIEDVIQTDTAINQGNSGGPLLNLKGEVVGIDTAMVQGAQNIGFAIPINKAKKDIEQIKTLGKIVYPYLGVRYVLITEKIQEDNNLLVSYGAWIIKGYQGESAVASGSAAEKAGLKEKDIILEFNEERITVENSLAKIIMKYNPGDRVVLKILRNGKEEIIQATLDEISE
ncbi:MAG: trypsin-like peptidase domain-containing protein [Candidatus Nealsonbacteria bacterium]|nr:trypsin-like peptidase domain-containing protein [Candidatus Nealsonbacteria bacterium]